MLGVRGVVGCIVALIATLTFIANAIARNEAVSDQDVHSNPSSVSFPTFSLSGFDVLLKSKDWVLKEDKASSPSCVLESAGVNEINQKISRREISLIPLLTPVADGTKAKLQFIFKAPGGKENTENRIFYSASPDLRTTLIGTSKLRFVLEDSIAGDARTEEVAADGLPTGAALQIFGGASVSSLLEDLKHGNYIDVTGLSDVSSLTQRGKKLSDNGRKAVASYVAARLRLSDLFGARESLIAHPELLGKGDMTKNLEGARSFTVLEDFTKEGEGKRSKVAENDRGIPQIGSEDLEVVKTFTSEDWKPFLPFRDNLSLWGFKDVLSDAQRHCSPTQPLPPAVPMVPELDR